MFLHSITLFIITFIFIFGWKVTELADLIFLSSLVLIFTTFVVLKRALTRYTIIMFLLLLSLSTYSLLVFILNESTDIQFALRSIRSMINFVGGVALAHLYWKFYGRKVVQYIPLHIFFALVLHGLLITLMYLIEELRLFIYNLTSAYSIVNPNTPFLRGYRIPGLTYGLATTSVLQMFGLLLIPIVLHYWAKNFRRILIVIFSSILLVISILLTGNTGLLIAIFLFPITVIISYKDFIFRTLSVKMLKKFSKYIIIILIIIIFFHKPLLSIMPDHFFNYTLNKAKEVQEFFTNMGETRTTYILKEMYHLPQNPWVFLFGSSELARGEPGKTPSDVGWVRVIFAVGVIGTILMLLPFLYSIFKAKHVLVLDRHLGTVVIAILLSSIILHFKEMGMYTRNAWSVQSLLIGTCFILLKNNWKCNDVNEITKKTS